MNVKWIGSKNYSSRKGYAICAIMNHIMEGTLAGTASHFNKPGVDASAQYGVGKSGEIHQYVKDEHAAWHAGNVRSPKIALPHPSNVTPNLYTIGIEWEGRSGEPITETQYAAGLALHRHLLSNVVVATLPLRQRVIGHSQTNSIDRPNCPGPAFPWERLYKDLASFESGPRIIVNDRTIALPVKLEGGRTYVQLKGDSGLVWVQILALSEFLGASLAWDQASQIAKLTVK